jgi:transposase
VQIVLPQAGRYFMHSGCVDMRKGFDGLSGVVQQDFHQSALSGDVFIFLNGQRNRIKLLHWQGDGFVIYYKRLEKGTFELPKADSQNKSISISHQQLQFILDGIVLTSIKKRKRFQV